MTTSYHLVGIGTGHVLAVRKESGLVVLENKGEQDDEQKWTVEFGDEPDLVALKSVANGKYMWSREGGTNNANAVKTGDKQWWKLSNDGLTPNVACRFNLPSSPGNFIYTHGAVLEKGKEHSAHMREWTPNWQKDFGFYFVDASTGFEPAAPMPATSATPKEKLVASNTKPQDTDSTKAYYVTATTHGHLLAQLGSKASSRVVFEYTRNRTDQHKWIVERGDEPDIIALKNVADGKYLCYSMIREFGEIFTGNKTWWRASTDTTPVGSYRLVLMDNPKLSFHYGVGNYPRGNTTLYKYQEGREYEHTLYFIDTSATPNLTSLGPSGGASSKEESDAKLKALEDREAALLQKESDQSAELDKKAKELQERQDALDQEEKKRAASKTDFDSKLKALEDREAKLTQKDKDRSAELDKKEKEIQALQDSLAQQEKDREAASTKKDSERSAEWDKQMKDVQDRQDSSAREDKDREAASTKKNSDSSAEWDKKMKEVQERQDALAKEEKDRAASYEKKLKELQAREDGMAKKEEEQKSFKDTSSTKSGKDAAAKNDAETQRKLDDLKATEQKIAADRASLEKSKADFAAEQKRFQKRQKAFDDQKSSSQDDASQAKNENAALEKRMAQLEDQLTQMDNAARNSKSGKPQANANANGTEASSGCNYSGLKHYKPPRKLGRKVIGIVYE